jgi:hypothetical protein
MSNRIMTKLFGCGGLALLAVVVGGTDCTCNSAPPGLGTDGGVNPPPTHCQTANQCAAPTPLCDTSAGFCVACFADSDCSTGKRCDPRSHLCTNSCDTDMDCQAPAGRCNAATRECVACLGSGDCAPSVPVCDPTSRTCVPQGNGSNQCKPPASLTLSPINQTAMVTAGQPFMLQFSATAHFGGEPDKDVTGDSFFGASDPAIGAFSGGTFTWSGQHGGHVTVSALYCGVTGTTELELSLTARIGAGGTDPAAAGMRFDGPMSSNAACNPSLVYPPDGILLPPNTNVIEVHFKLGQPASSLYEVSFTNALTNVRIYTTCAGATAAQGTMLGGGCVLDQAAWDFVARTNADRDPVTVQVRGVGCDGANVSASNTRQISFAREDLVGALYYWASQRAVENGQSVFSGGVYRYDFGVRGQTADPVLTPSSSANPNALCIGCHSISRDGRKMVFNFDDNDADDEFGDVRTDVYDIASAQPAQPIIKNGELVFRPGYSSWNRETSEFLLSDGFGNDFTNGTARPGAFERVSPTGMHLGYAQAGALRGTTPDWAPDDSQVVFAAPPNVLSMPPNPGFWMKTKGPADDLWFAGASLYLAAWNPATKSLGDPTMLIPSMGSDNYYYPNHSPEGSLIAFNHAVDGPNFHNPKARVSVVASGQANPTALDLARLNDMGPLTNSWPRWSPFLQRYKGGELLWITMSSTRNYGLRIVNDGKVNCVPKESPGSSPVFVSGGGGRMENPICNRTQLWMAAVKLDVAAVKAGTDVSFPAFFLPFQDQTTNNHLAQWAQRSFRGTCSADADCNSGGQHGRCCDHGGCTACPAPPPATPICVADIQCPPTECCSSGLCTGACQVTSSTDGGVPTDGAVSTDGGRPVPPTSCNTCLDCQGQACNGGLCGGCTNSAQCCAPLVCVQGQCASL